MGVSNIKRGMFDRCGRLLEIRLKWNRRLRVRSEFEMVKCKCKLNKRLKIIPVSETVKCKFKKGIKGLDNTWVGNGKM